MLKLIDNDTLAFQFVCPNCDRYVRCIGDCVVHVPGLRLPYPADHFSIAYNRPKPGAVALEEFGEFEPETDEEGSDSGDLRSCCKPSDTAPVPVDPDREALRTNPIRSIFDLQEPSDYSSVVWWQGRYRVCKPQPEEPPPPGEGRPPTPDIFREHRVCIVSSVRQAGLPGGLNDLEEYSLCCVGDTTPGYSDTLVYKLRDVLYCLGLSVQGCGFSLLRRLLAHCTGQDSGHLCDRTGVDIKSDNIDWRAYPACGLDYKGLLKLCYGLGVLKSSKRSQLELYVRTFKNDSRVVDRREFDLKSGQYKLEDFIEPTSHEYQAKSFNRHF